MSLNAEYNNTIDFLQGILSKRQTSKKQITDKDLKSTDLEAIQERAQTYTGYLKNYVDDYKRKTIAQQRMKSWFFIIVMFLLAVIVIGSVVSLILISRKLIIRLNDLATVITALVGAISSFLILPKIIADNLFPKKEDDKTGEIFSKMFEHDFSLRGMYHVQENIERDSNDSMDISVEAEDRS